MRNNVRNSRLSAYFAPSTWFAHKTATLAGAVHDVGVLRTPAAQATVVVLTSANADSVSAAFTMARFGRALGRILGEPDRADSALWEL